MVRVGIGQVQAGREPASSVAEFVETHAESASTRHPRSEALAQAPSRPAGPVYTNVTVWLQQWRNRVGEASRAGNARPRSDGLEVGRSRPTHSQALAAPRAGGGLVGGFTPASHLLHTGDCGGLGLVEHIQNETLGTPCFRFQESVARRRPPSTPGQPCGGDLHQLCTRFTPAISTGELVGFEW